MKKIYLILLLAISLSTCKKDALKVDVDKTFVETGKSAGSLGFGGIILTLMPDGKADFLNAGDVMERGTYEVNGINLTLKINTKEYKFKVISTSELRYGNDRTLALQVQ